MYEISPVRRKGELAGEHACTRPQCERRSRRGTIGGLHRPFRTLLRPDTPGRCGEPVVRRRRGGRRTWRSDPRLAVGHPARRSRRRPGTARHHRHPRRGTREPGENAAEGTARHRTIMDQGGVELFAPARRTRWYVEPFPARHAEIGLGVGHNAPQRDLLADRRRDGCEGPRAVATVAGTTGLGRDDAPRLSDGSVLDGHVVLWPMGAPVLIGQGDGRGGCFFESVDTAESRGFSGVAASAVSGHSYVIIRHHDIGCGPDRPSAQCPVQHPVSSGRRGSA